MGKYEAERARQVVAGNELGGEKMKEICCFVKGEEQINISSEQIKKVGEIAIKAILTHLPEEQRTYDIVKYILNTACDLLGEKEIKL